MNSGYTGGGSTSSANNSAYLSDSVSASGGTPTQNLPSSQKSKSGGDVEAAVFSYIQAIRALGKTGVNTAEISRALGLPLSQVEGVIKNLAKKGVKFAA